MLNRMLNVLTAREKSASAAGSVWLSEGRAR